MKRRETLFAMVEIKLLFFVAKLKFVIVNHWDGWWNGKFLGIFPRLKKFIEEIRHQSLRTKLLIRIFLRKYGKIKSVFLNLFLQNIKIFLNSKKNPNSKFWFYFMKNQCKYAKNSGYKCPVLIIEDNRTFFYNFWIKNSPKNFQKHENQTKNTENLC